MKGRLCAALAAAVLIGWRAPRALAQPADGGAAPADAGAAPAGGDEARPPQGPDGGDAGDAGLRMAKRRLKLSDEAAAKFEAAVKARRAASEPLQKQVRESMQKLSRQLREKAADADVQSTLDALATARKGLRDQEETFENAVKGFLTATQRARLLLDRMPRPRDRRGWGGRGGSRGGGDRGDGGGMRGGDERRPDGPPPQEGESDN
jgi:Spy/CpxP family protein refolding chaperone